jgi:hypothetical protein
VLLADSLSKVDEGPTTQQQDIVIEEDAMPVEMFSMEIEQKPKK